MTVLVTIESVVVLLLAIVVVGLLRSHAEILRTLHDFGVDLDPARNSEGASAGAAFAGAEVLPVTRRPSSAPVTATAVSGTTPAGDTAVIALTGTGQRTLLAFLTSSCLTCTGFWEAFADPVALDLPPGVRIVVVTKGTDQESPAAIAGRAPRGVTTVLSSEAWLEHEIQVAPYFVLVDDDGRVLGEGAALTWPQVRSLLTQALADEEAAAASGPDDDRRRRSAGRGRYRPAADAAREADVDRELLQAGIQPGDPRLYHEPDRRL
jgi:hypothetical protein